MKRKTLLSLIAIIALFLAACGGIEETAKTNVNDSAVGEKSKETESSAQNDLMMKFEALMGELYADPDPQKKEICECILQYCIMVQSEGVLHEETIMYMRDYLDEEETYNAFVTLINNNREEILNGYVEEDKIWYSEDFNSLYNEFLSNQQTSTTIDTVEKALANISLTDNVIYNENGVIVTLDSFDGTSKMHLTLNNNNDSNKKVNFNIKHVYVNGIKISSSWIPIALVNGQTVQIEVGLQYGVIDYIYNKLGTNYTDSPLETVQIDYQIQIGSDSEPVDDSIVLQTENYNNNSFFSLFGEYFTTLDVTNKYSTKVVSAETYGKLGDTACVFYLKGIVEGISIEAPYTGDLLANESEICVDDVWYGDTNTSFGRCGKVTLSDGILLVINCSEDELRKQCEIANDEPINVILEINGNPYTVFTK